LCAHLADSPLNQAVGGSYSSVCVISSFRGEFIIQLLTDNNDLADGYAAKLPAAPDGLPPAGERGIVPHLVGQKIGSKYAIG
jgi:hypothetical protein